LFSPALGSLALPVIPSSFRPMTDQGFFQPLPLCHLLVCAVVVCYFDSLDSKLAPQPVAFYAVVFFLVNATYVCLIWELISRSRGFADRGRHHALSIGHHLIPFWNCRHYSAEISTGWTWNLHLLPDRLSEARSARIGEVKNLMKTQAPLRPLDRLSTCRRCAAIPPRFGLSRFCAKSSCKSSGCQPPGN
jgi:hypothetical protein